MAQEHAKFTSAGAVMGVRLTLAADRADLLDAMRDALPGFRADPRGSRGRSLALVQHDEGIVLRVDGRRRTRPRRRAEALAEFRRRAQLLVAEEARHHVFVHAGVVGWKGRAIVIAGRSRSGKTSLVKALLELGAVYLSDEYAPIDAHGKVHPWPRPLQIRTSRGFVRRSASALGAATSDGALPAGAVILTRYRPGARWEAARVSRGKAVLGLFANTVSARAAPLRAMRWLSRAVRRASLVLEGERGEAGQAARVLLDSVEVAER